MPWREWFEGKVWRDDAGASLLEFAISASVLLSMIMGIMLISLAIYTHHELAEVARDATRYASVHGNTCSVSGSSCTATATQVQNYAKSLEYPGIDGSKLTVTATYSSYPSGSSCTPNTNCENPGDLVTVTVTFPYSLGLPFVSSRVLSMTSTSAMVISN